MVALPLLAAHVPPVVVSVRVGVAPTVSEDEPVMLPASGAGSTIIVLVTKPLPQVSLAL